MNRLQGRVALVTGAAQGIGRAIAELFAAEGADVIATDIRHPPEGIGAELDFEVLDVSRQDDWTRVIDTAVARFGKLDILINNAGIVLAYETIDATDDAGWDRVVAVNQTGTFLGMRSVIPHMRAAGGGSIVNLCSIWGSVGAPGAAAYQAAKGAVRNLTKNAAISYAKENIRANSVHPGIIWTPLISAQPEAMNEAIVAMTPMGRMGRPDDIAQGCLFLASDEAAFITGAELAIDGGYLAQ